MKVLDAYFKVAGVASAGCSAQLIKGTKMPVGGWQAGKAEA